MLLRLCCDIMKVVIKKFLRVRICYLVIGAICLWLLDYFGAFVHVFERDFYSEFSYPLRGDWLSTVEQLRENDSHPSVPPINQYNYKYISSCEKKCKDASGNPVPVQLLYVIKSALRHFDRRSAIRNSWGFERRFSDVPIKRIFLLGMQNDDELQAAVTSEQQKYNDIVQAAFTDTYFNNTIKTMMGYKWVVTYCQSVKFVMFVDDDYYVSTKNVLRFVRNPTQYPEYLEKGIESFDDHKTRLRRSLQQVIDFELSADVRLYSGFVFHSAPHRHRFSKWYVSLDEYPFHLWPPYVTAGSVLLSREALTLMYYMSYYTKHFRFDDIYVGLLAKRARIEPYHCDEFHFWGKAYDVQDYQYVISAHGYSDPQRLREVWEEQKSVGHA